MQMSRRDVENTFSMGIRLQHSRTPRIKLCGRSEEVSSGTLREKDIKPKPKEGEVIRSNKKQCDARTKGTRRSREWSRRI